MRFRSVGVLAAVVLPLAAGAAQVSQESRFAILGTLIADTAASRIVMPLGDDGVELSEAGVVNQEELRDQLGEEGRAISAGDVVTITAISFGGDTIEVELNGGGTNDRGILDRIRVGIGGRTNPVSDQEEEPAKGSKIVLRFEDEAPSNLTVAMLKTYLSPVLDFNKQNFMDSGIESLPEEFQEAVRAKEARIGMDQSTVLMARGRPHDRIRETTPEGVEQEHWIYRKPGFGADFIVFEGDVVVSIKRY